MTLIFPGLHYSISYTTRPPRPNEENGREYHFVSAEKFQKMIDGGDFAEWAEIYGHRYGTSRVVLEQIRNAGRDVIVDIDGQGVRQLREKNLGGIFIFVLPPSLEELEKRLARRKTEGKAALGERLRKARAEMAEARWYEYLIINDKLEMAEKQLKAIILAAGYATRLRPLTESCAKPLLPVGGRPLLELMIEQLRQSGIRRVNLAIHYKGESISQHFGDGQNFGMEINYVKEDQPLGTAGALGMLNVSNEPLLVINGDVLTRVDFPAMLDFHRQLRADMTIGVRKYEFRVPYGVIETDGVTVVNISEKPVMRHFINAGIYLLNPEVCKYVPASQAYDMTELINRLIAEKRRVVVFPIREYWLDIGQHADYQQAQADMEGGKF